MNQAQGWLPRLLTTLELTLRGLLLADKLIDWLGQQEGPQAGAFAEVIDAIEKLSGW